MNIEVFDETTEYVIHLIEEFANVLDEEARQTGIRDLCPKCLANTWVDKNNTLIMTELYKIAKEEPLAFLSALNRSMYLAVALQTILVRVISDGLKLFEDELKTDEPQADDCD